MSSSQDVDGAEARRSKRRVRVRKATPAETTTTTGSALDGAAAPDIDDDMGSSAAAGESAAEAAREDSSAGPVKTAAGRVRRKRTPATTIDGGDVDDSELTSAHQLALSEAPTNGDVAVPPLTAACDDNMAIDDGNDQRPPGDSAAHLLPASSDAPKKSRGKRRVKNKERPVAAAIQASNEEHQLINGGIDVCELTSPHELPAAPAEAPVDKDVGVHPSSAADDNVAVDDGNYRPSDDDKSPTHLQPSEAPKKSRGKRRAKNRERPAATNVEHRPVNGQAAEQITSEQPPVNGLQEDGGVSGDWLTAVRSEDIAVVRRLAASAAVDVNSTDEVSRK